MISIPRLLFGALLALVVSLLAWRVKSLSASGAFAASLLGAVVFGLGGLGWAILLLAFFISSSALSRLFRWRKRPLDEKFSKGSQRDAKQVAANGAVAGLFVLAAVLAPMSSAWAWAAFSGALAAANADTWATELGVLGSVRPRLITTGKPVERGTSGGVSLPGSLAALGGAALIALLAVLLWGGRLQSSALSQPQSLAWLAWITGSGFAGSLVDSLLGATVQAIYFCPTCQKETERYPTHICGSPTRWVRGFAWLDNDWVNIICTLTGALVALLGAFVLR